MARPARGTELQLLQGIDSTGRGICAFAEKPAAARRGVVRAGRNEFAKVSGAPRATRSSRRFGTHSVLEARVGKGWVSEQPAVQAGAAHVKINALNGGFRGKYVSPFGKQSY